MFSGAAYWHSQAAFIYEKGHQVEKKSVPKKEEDHRKTINVFETTMEDPKTDTKETLRKRKGTVGDKTGSCQKHVTVTRQYFGLKEE